MHLEKNDFLKIVYLNVVFENIKLPDDLFGNILLNNNIYMFISIGKDNNWDLEVYPTFVLSNKTIATWIEIEWKVYELLINCPYEQRNTEIQSLLDNIEKWKK